MPSLKLADGVKFTDNKINGTLFETKSERVFTLNPTSCIIVREIALGHRNTVAELVKGIEALYEDPENKLGDETRSFCAALKEAGLLEIAP